MIYTAKLIFFDHHTIKIAYKIYKIILYMTISLCWRRAFRNIFCLFYSSYFKENFGWCYVI